MKWDCEQCGSRLKRHFDFHGCLKCWKPQPMQDVMDVHMTIYAAEARTGKSGEDLVQLCMERDYFFGNDSVGHIPVPSNLDPEDEYDQPFLEYKEILEEMYKIAAEAGCPKPNWLLRW